MVRRWSFHRSVLGGTSEQPIGADRLQLGGSVNETVTFGPTALHPPGTSDDALGQVFSNETGETYWVLAQGPSATLNPGVTIGTSTELTQFQLFRKADSNATLRLVVSDAFLQTIDGNGGIPDDRECPWGPVGSSPLVFCKRVLWSWIDFDVAAASEQKLLLRTGGFAELFGWTATWDRDVYTSSAATVPFWGPDQFEFLDAVGQEAQAFLKAPIVINVPLDSVPVGGLVSLMATVKAATQNRRQRETYLQATVRDPAGSNGLSFSFAGLEPLETPTQPPAEIPPTPAPACAGGASGGGQLQFESPTFIVPEMLGDGATIVVTRTGGTSGMVSASLSATGGTAVPGTDYTPAETLVLFADGEGGSRALRIPILVDNTTEPDKTVNLTLSSPSGCVTLGSPSTAILTLMDADRPVIQPTSFTVGGTLGGLAGTGLVLTNQGTNLSPTADGPFVFGLHYADGLPYDVRVITQPTNPDQVCSVANGAGTIAGQDITDVEVSCVTPSPNGSLDPTYGVAGKASTTAAGGIGAMVLQTDGKAVVVGQRYVARFTTSGSLDSSFGGNGVVPVSFTASSDELQGVALQPDGRIVVVGFAHVNGQIDFAVARFLSEGTLDGSFGTGGKVTTDFNGQVDEAWAALVQSDGSIVVAGHAATSTALGLNHDFAVARYTSAGVLDQGFGTGGKVTTNIGGRTDLAHAAALQADGKILLTGRVADGGGDDPDVALVRYTTSGTPDPSFGTAGIQRIDLSNGSWDEAADLMVQPDGTILVAVEAVVGGRFDFEVARFTSGGSLDSGFGTQGLATVGGFSTQNDVIRGLARQADGKIVVVGGTALADFAIARFTAAGLLDTGFDGDGRITVDFFAGSDGAEAVGIQPDGRIVVAGGATNGSAFVAALVRVVP
jgi:uncharacterized delta-60 repeat protein